MPRRPPSASPLEAHLGYWLRAVSNQVSARFEAELAMHDIRLSDWVAMRTLYAQAHITHTQLIQALGMTKGAASKVITRLEAKGLATRLPSEHSSRDQWLALTSQGRRLLPRLAALADDNDAHFFGHLGATQRRQLMDLMQALARHHDITAVPTS